MGAFSIASILGVPAGLELAQRGGWRLPFIAVAILGALIGTFAFLTLPPMVGHLAQANRRPFGRDLVALIRSDVVLSLSLTTLVMAASFVIVPSITPYVLFNLHYPRTRLGLLYLVGGAVSFVAMRGVGSLVDRFGSARVGTVGVLLTALVTYLGFACVPPLLGVMAMFVGLMLSMAIRNVSYNTLATKVPRPEERARFSSIQSAAQHLASALGAFASTQFLTQLPDQTLVGIPNIAFASIALSLAIVPLLWVVEGRVRGAAGAR